MKIITGKDKRMFGYTEANDVQLEMINSTRNSFLDLIAELRIPNGRGRDEMIKNLEIAQFYAIKAICGNDE